MMSRLTCTFSSGLSPGMASRGVRKTRIIEGGEERSLDMTTSVEHQHVQQTAAAAIEAAVCVESVRARLAEGGREGGRAMPAGQAGRQADRQVERASSSLSLIYPSNGRRKPGGREGGRLEKWRGKARSFVRSSLHCETELCQWGNGSFVVHSAAVVRRSVGRQLARLDAHGGGRKERREGGKEGRRRPRSVGL